MDPGDRRSDETDEPIDRDGSNAGDGRSGTNGSDTPDSSTWNDRDPRPENDHDPRRNDGSGADDYTNGTEETTERSAPTPRERDETKPKPRDYDTGRSRERDETERSNPPAPKPGSRDATESDSPITHVLTVQEGPWMWIREVVTSALVVLAIGVLLFGLSGAWPPMVAVESGSMEPNMVKGDLVFVTEPGRFAPDEATNDIGVVTHEHGHQQGYETFGSSGSVVVFSYPGQTGSPIIHRAMFHVEAGENWVDRADDRYIQADSCEQALYCPAPHSGFITKGDNNAQYDQANGIAPPVQSEWVTGVARVRVPYLGWIRLIASGEATTGEFIQTVLGGSPTLSEVSAPPYTAGSSSIGVVYTFPALVTAGGLAAIARSRRNT